jgi:hypothetical protein
LGGGGKFLRGGFGPGQFDVFGDGGVEHMKTGKAIFVTGCGCQ